MNRPIFLILFFICSIQLQAQIKSFGLPYIKNYTPDEMGIPPENWKGMQSKIGLIYVVNKSGLVEYDGSDWRLYPVKGSNARSMDMDENGRIYIGADGEIGYFEGDEHGMLQYYSLKPLIPQYHENFSDIWNTFVVKDAVIFQGNHKIFIYKDKKIKVLTTDTQFRSSALINNKMYLWEDEKGLQVLEADILVQEASFEGQNFDLIMPFDGHRLLLFSNNAGFKLYSLETYQDWGNKYIADFIGTNKVEAAIRLDPQYLAVSTHQNGVLILDNSGNVIQHLNKEKGLQSNTALGLFTDREKGLWITLKSGIDYVDIYSPFTFFDDKLKIYGVPYASALERDTLYFGTSEGLYYNSVSNLHDPLGTVESFKAAAGTEGQVLMLKSSPEGLICTHDGGGFQLIEGRPEEFSNLEGTMCMLEPSRCKQKVLAASNDGLYLFEESDGMLFFQKKLNFNLKIRSLEEDAEGNIWAAGFIGGIYKLVLDSTCETVLSWENYIGKKGLPPDQKINLYKIGKDLYFSGEKGIYQYSMAEDLFEPDQKFNEIFGEKSHVRKLCKDPKGNIWFSVGDEIGFVRQTGGGEYKKFTQPFKPFYGLMINDFEQFSWIDNHNIFINTRDNIIHYDPSIEKDYDKGFPVLVRKVELMEEKDSVVFDGFFKDMNGKLISFQNNAFIPSFAYYNNSVRITCAGLTYFDPRKTLFRFKLEGFDERWTGWTNKNYKEYTNLPSGEYTFYVTAKNIYDVTGTTATYTFRIKKPWYETIGFYIFQILFLLLLLAISYLFNKTNKESKLSYFLSLLTIITIFEFIILLIEPTVDNISGGVPIFKLVMNIILAFSLNPLEHWTRKSLFLLKGND